MKRAISAIGLRYWPRFEEDNVQPFSINSETYRRGTEHGNFLIHRRRTCKHSGDTSRTTMEFEDQLRSLEERFGISKSERARELGHTVAQLRD